MEFMMIKNNTHIKYTLVLILDTSLFIYSTS
jgi:hypothetical protein